MPGPDVAALAHGTGDAVAAVVVDDPVSSRRRRLGLSFVLAAIEVGLVIGAAVFAEILPLQPPEAINPLSSRQGPSADHWLGTDQLGRDILSRLVYGARTSLTVAFLATLVAAVFGFVIGVISGYMRGISETLGMGAMDVLVSFPALILAIALTAVLGGGVLNVVIAIALLALPAFARIARADTLTYTEREFVQAARTLGARRTRILFREIGPNVLPTLASYGLVIVAVAIVTESSLSFLGLGVPVETPTWGGMIAQGRPELERHPHITFIPAAAMFLTVLALNTLGDRLRSRSSALGGAEG